MHRKQPRSEYLQLLRDIFQVLVLLVHFLQFLALILRQLIADDHRGASFPLFYHRRCFQSLVAFGDEPVLLFWLCL